MRCQDLSSLFDTLIFSNCISCLLWLLFFSYGIAAISPFSHRLAFENLPGDIQRLRCKVNFQALAFVSHINALGETLVKRLRSPVHKQPEEFLKEVADENVQEGPGKFAVLHLRFDKVHPS